MGIHDLAFEWIGNTWPDRLAADLLGEPVKVRPLARGRPHMKREADFAVVVTPPGRGAARRRYVLHAEHVKEKIELRRVVLYHAIYHHDTGLPVITVVVQSSRRDARRVPKVYRFGRPEEQTQVPLRRVRLWKLRAEQVLRESRWELFPFLAVMRRSPSMSVQTLLEEGRRRILQGVRPGAERDQLIAAFRFVSEEQLGDGVVDPILGGAAEMAGTTLGQRLIQQGRNEGRKEGRVEALLTFLEARFGTVPSNIVEPIRSIEDENELERLVRLAATVDSLDALQQEI